MGPKNVGSKNFSQTNFYGVKKIKKKIYPKKYFCGLKQLWSKNSFYIKIDKIRDKLKLKLLLESLKVNVNADLPRH